MTLGDMCKEIADSEMLTKKDGTHPTAEEIFNYSPTGELFMVFQWYQELQLIKDGVNKLARLFEGIINTDH